MKKHQQLDLFKSGSDETKDVSAEKAALWEAEKEEFGFKTDREKRIAKERTKSFIAEEKERIFGKDGKKG